MSRFVSRELSEKIQGIMFGNSFQTPEECFLQEELARYVPQLIGRSDKEIASFIEYQRCLYLDGEVPDVGKPIASLNPTFIDSLDSVQLSRSRGKVYTRASVKENGYRMQIHLGIEEVHAFTRQFTRYDLRMFPELQRTCEVLPVMVGDAELVSKHHPHLAGFNRVQLRIPNQTYWPRHGQSGLEADALAKYLANPSLFSDGKSLLDTEMTLAFHGLFAIAHPDTWKQSREVQMNNLISLCQLPIDYELIDSFLSSLELFIADYGLNARVVQRFYPETHEQLVEYVETNKAIGLEGTCIVQSTRDEDGNLLPGSRSIKIKTYETVDCALLGVYVRNVHHGCIEENITGALLGLYDPTFGVYLSATRVNLDPEGVQIKTRGQYKRLFDLRKEIVQLLPGKVARAQGATIHTLYDTFLLEGAHLTKYLFKDDGLKSLVDPAFRDLPERTRMLSAFEAFEKDREAFLSGSVKKKTAVNLFVLKHIAFFKAVASLDNRSKKRFVAYFSQARELVRISSKISKPQFVVDATEPIILETQVFDLSWGKSPYPAGFHSWYCTSFRFNNVFAERVRHDKSTTTDFGTIHTIARKNTVHA